VTRNFNASMRVASKECYISWMSPLNKRLGPGMNTNPWCSFFFFFGAQNPSYASDSRVVIRLYSSALDCYKGRYFAQSFWVDESGGHVKLIATFLAGQPSCSNVSSDTHFKNVKAFASPFVASAKWPPIGLRSSRIFLPILRYDFTACPCQQSDTAHLAPLGRRIEASERRHDRLCSNCYRKCFGRRGVLRNS